MRPKFKPFNPKVDLNQNLVLSRFYCGINSSDLFMYTIHKITENLTIDENFGHLYCIGTHQINSVGVYHHSKTGEPLEALKMDFKDVSGCEDETNVLKIWKIATK